MNANRYSSTAAHRGRSGGTVLLRWVVVAVLTVAASIGVRLAAEPSATPRLDWLFDAAVNATARIGTTLYVGGGFAAASPASGTLSHLFALSPATGAPTPGLPAVDGQIVGLTPDGAGGYYISGTFLNIGSAGPTYGGFPSLMRMAHVLASGAVDAGFQPQVGGHIGGFVRVGPSLVVAGDLFIDGGITARALVALDPITGALSPWTPALPGFVRAMAAGNGVLYVMTSDVAGVGLRTVTAYDSATGTALWTSPAIGGPLQFGDISSGRLLVAGSRVVVGTDRLFALDVATGAIDQGWGGPAGPVSNATTALALSGSTIYVGGAFTTFHGQPRANLAAVDLATGAVLPWAPHASGAVLNVVVTPAGNVVVTPYLSLANLTFTINGQARTSRVLQVDPSGAVTSWTSEVRFLPIVVQVSADGALVFGSGQVPSPTTGGVTRAGLAAFDVTTGAVRPADITVSSSGAAGSVSSLQGVGQTLFLAGSFDTVNGVPRAGLAAVDATTNTVLPWPAAGVLGMSLAFVEGSWIYGYQVSGDLRRVHSASGALDPTFRVPAPYGTRAVVADHGELVAAIRAPSFPTVPIPPTLVGVLDPVTGAFVERFRIPILVESVDTMTVDGDTLYFAGPARGTQDIVGVLRAFHRTSGVPVSVPPVTGQFNGLVVADGRLFAYGGLMRIGATERLGIAELARPGTMTAFDAGAWVPDRGLRLAQRGVSDARAHGDYLVASGQAASGHGRVAAFPLSGTSVPASLRARNVGATTVFSWDPMVPPPSGGYVIEGGFAPGHAAAALAVGDATSVALPMPAGPVFVRVRPQGSPEVSNEIVAGCLAPPLPPTALTTTLAGTMLTLAWTPPAAAVTNYTLLAGTAAGLSNVVTSPLGSQTSVSGTVPGGTFFARITATNACGTSGPSGEVFFTIGAPDPLPAAPTNISASVSGSTVTLSWTAPTGAVTSYVLEAGTAAGLANLGTLSIGATPSLVIPGVPAGTYVLRVRAVTSAGSGAPSSDVVVTVQ